MIFYYHVSFDLNYIDENGTKQTPVVIHRAILGTFERFIAYLLEEYKGALPLWIAPIQIAVIPVHHEYHLEYVKDCTRRNLEVLEWNLMLRMKNLVIALGSK